MPRSAGVLFGGSSETVDRGARDKRDEMGWQQRAQSAASEQREERATTTIADPRRRGVLNSGVSLAGWCVQPRADERRESPQLRTVASRWRDALRATAASPLGRSEPTDGGRAPRSGGRATCVLDDDRDHDRATATASSPTRSTPRCRAALRRHRAVGGAEVQGGPPVGAHKACRLRCTTKHIHGRLLVFYRSRCPSGEGACVSDDLGLSVGDWGFQCEAPTRRGVGGAEIMVW